MLPVDGLDLAYAVDPISSIILLKDYIVINMELKYWNFSYLPLHYRMKISNTILKYSMPHYIAQSNWQFILATPS